MIRINSQSGKGGIAYLLERDRGVVMPRRMQVEFSALVQRRRCGQGGDDVTTAMGPVRSDVSRLG